LTGAIAFPLLVLIAYFRSYYFRPFFDLKPVASGIVHAHGIVMTLWVIYFSAQIALIRTRNVRLHMTLGAAGFVLAALAVVTGLWAAYNAHLVRGGAPPGIHPHAFFIVPFGDVVLFVVFVGAAIYFRRRPTEHKSLMLMTAINFLPPALGRIPFMAAKLGPLWSWGVPDLLALGCLGWLTWKHRQLNKIFAAAVALLIVSQPVRILLSGSTVWLEFTGWLRCNKFHTFSRTIQNR
jgi:hypothetical protein